MARRPLLNDEERQLPFDVPDDPDALARHYTVVQKLRLRGVSPTFGFGSALIHLLKTALRIIHILQYPFP